MFVELYAKFRGPVENIRKPNLMFMLEHIFMIHEDHLYIRALIFAQKSYSTFVCLLKLIFDYIRIFINNILTIKCLQYDLG